MYSVQGASLELSPLNYIGSYFFEGDGTVPLTRLVAKVYSKYRRRRGFVKTTFWSQLFKTIQVNTDIVAYLLLIIC